MKENTYDEDNLLMLQFLPLEGRLLDGVFKQFVKPGDFSALTFLLSAANCILAI